MRTIDTTQLNELRRQNDHLAIVNVLPQEQFLHRHIPGSKNVPLSEADFAEKVANTIGGKDEPVIVYCASEECDASEKAAKKLDEVGFEDVHDYVGGMRAWQESGEPVQAGARSGSLG